MSGGITFINIILYEPSGNPSTKRPTPSESKRWIIYSNKYNLYNISMLTFVVPSDEIRVYWQGVVLALRLGNMRRRPCMFADIILSPVVNFKIFATQCTKCLIIPVVTSRKPSFKLWRTFPHRMVFVFIPLFRLFLWRSSHLSKFLQSPLPSYMNIQQLTNIVYKMAPMKKFQLPTMHCGTILVPLFKKSSPRNDNSCSVRSINVVSVEKIKIR